MSFLDSTGVTELTRDLKALTDAAYTSQTSIATVETSTTASKAYAKGDYLMLNNTLYKVIAAISSGGTITVGTNVGAVKVTDELGGTGLPDVTASDNGKFLCVVNGAWAAAELQSASGVSF